jgi:hypothetical protein
VTTTEHNTPTVDDLQASVQRLQTALNREREDHKATKAQQLAPVRTALGLPEDAPLDTITTTLSQRLGDIDAQVNAKTENIAAERDAAVAEAAKVRDEWNAHRIDAAVQLALQTSGIRPECFADATTILRGALEATEKGVVRTKAAPNIVPGQTPEQFIAGQLKSLRPHYWPTSVGGGARGGGVHPTTGGDTSAFRTGNVTGMMAYIARHGERAAIEACRRSGVPVPSFLRGAVAR